MKQELKNGLAYLLRKPHILIGGILLILFLTAWIFLAIANRELRHDNKELKTQISELQEENQLLEQAVKDREERITKKTIIADSLKSHLAQYKNQLILIDETGANIRNADLEYHIGLLSRFLSQTDSLSR